MELIIIDELRLKIILSREEMQSYGIDAAGADMESEDVKRTLCGILERAKHTAGFSCDCGRVFVQLFASRDGGCEMFVTRYSELCDSEDGRIFEGEDGDDMSDGRLRRRYAYRLFDTGDLLRLCLALKKRDFAGESDAYISADGNELYLVLHENGGKDISVAVEFGETVSLCALPAYISEHCEPICERDAVDRLAQLL